MSNTLDRIRQLREAQSITQADLALRAGLSRQSLGAIEAGRVDPSLSVVMALARALGTSVDGLLDPTNEDILQASALGVARVGDRVVVAKAGEHWVAHGLSEVDADQPADGTVTAVRGAALEVDLWGQPDATQVVLPGCMPILAVAAQRMNLRRPDARFAARYSWVHRTSKQALAALARGEALIAGVHGERPPRDRNARVAMLAWQSGLIVARGNPRHLKSLADLADVNGAARRALTIAAREPEAETRRLLERLLVVAGLVPEVVLTRARVAPTHADVARAVALGLAHVGFGPRAAALAAGLDFVPLAEEHFDLVVAPVSLDDPRVSSLLDLARSRGFRREAAALGYETPSVAER